MAAFSSAAVPAAPAARPHRFDTYLKSVFINMVRYLEVCALPYLAGIASGVGFDLKIPPAVWAALSTLGVWGTVLVLYGPIILLHAFFIQWMKTRHPEQSPIVFLEDGVTEHRCTVFLAVLAACVSIVFGVINYNFAVDISHPRHISRHVVKPWETNPVSLDGKIVREPDFREHAVWLYLQPRMLDGREPIEKGLVLVQVARTVEGFEEFEYGQHIQVKGNLVEPEAATNPETFDYKRWLNNRNVFGLIRINKPENVRYLGVRESNPVFDISLWVKKKFLGIMKQTLPYPHSAFQGGIIYGLKTGLDPVIHFEFKWAGMAWVLVVAGAHLLMVYLTLKMILESIRPNPKIAFTVLFVLLIMFLILTGINPPTVRAFIMIMLYEFTKVFLGQDIRAAVRSAIGIAAFLLLSSHVFPYFSPLLIFEPTVTLSFGAVLSLVYLSRPIEHMLRRYCYGMTSVVVLGGVTASLVYLSLKRPVTLSLMFWQQIPIWVVTLICAVITARINDRYRDRYQLDQIYLGYNDPARFHGWLRWIHPTFLTYNNLPRWVLGFVGAQIAIQFGMVMPLSSWYFQRSPVGGLLANIVAFPALGVIIQVGLVAVLIGMIPVIGLPLAFILNAADYLGIELLMFLARVSKEFFPYPMAMKPTGSQLLLYYGILFGFVLFDKIFYSFEKHGYLTLREVLEQKFLFTKRPFYARMIRVLSTPKREWLFVGVVAVLLAGVGCYMAQGRKLDHLKIIVMELDEGAGTVIMTPGGTRFLVDGGGVSWNPRFNVGERTVAQVLLGQQIEHIDAVFITSFNSTNIGGLPFILENFTVGRVFVPYDPAILTSDEEFTSHNYMELAAKVDREGDRAKISMMVRRGRVSTKQVVESIEAIRKAVRSRQIPVSRLSEGAQVLKGSDVQIDVLNPVADKSAMAGRGLVNNGLVLRITYGGNSVLLPGDLDADGEAELIARAKNLKSRFVLVPAHGDEESSGDAFLKAVQPEYAAVQYRRPFRRPTDRARLDRLIRRLESAGIKVDVRMEDLDAFEQVVRLYEAAGAKVLRTDLNGAILIDAWADGRFSVSPMLKTAQKEIAAETEADESDTDVQDRSMLKSEGTGL